MQEQNQGSTKLGLFAVVLLVSFLLHSWLLTHGTISHLKQMQETSAEQILTQLREDSIAELGTSNRVALALLVNRYTKLPTVASIRVLNAEKQQILHSGDSKTRVASSFSKEIKHNNKLYGYIELSLTETSASEVIANIWWTLLLSFIFHLAVFGFFVAFSRPRLTERQNALVEKQHTQNQIKQLQMDLEDERGRVAYLRSMRAVVEDESAPIIDHRMIALKIAFYDQQNLAGRIAPTLASRYFETCQFLLEQSIELSCKHYMIEIDEVKVLHPFNEKGTTLSISTDIASASECLCMINDLMSVLLETIYTTFVNRKQFALPICSAIAMQVNGMELDPVQAAEELVRHAKKQQSLIYVKSEQYRFVSQLYQLVGLANPSDILMRHSYVITGMAEERARIITQYRDEIFSR